MRTPKICASIVENNPQAIKDVAELVDLFEVRIDLIGDAWPGVMPHLSKPWIACNRKVEEGGVWRKSEAERVSEVLKAVDLGAHIIDIELSTENVKGVVSELKRKAECLLSFHDLEGTPPLNELKSILKKQQNAGADICKIVTTAQKFADNLTILQLIADFPAVRVVSFAMGPLGAVSRVLCPLVGGDFIYASVAGGKEAASGQITAAELRRFYEMVKA